MDESIVARMVEEIGAAPDLYKPANIWSELAGKHIALLKAKGVENFKKIVNRHYAEEQVISTRSQWFIALARAAGRDRPRFPYSIPRHSVFADDEAVLAYGAFVCMLWDYAEEALDGAPPGLLEEPMLGNPNFVEYQGRKITQDLCKSLIEYAKLKKHFGEIMSRGDAVVAEIGGGYGRLAHVVCSLNPCRYIFIDIPPTLYVAQWYIENLFGTDTVLPFAHYDSGAELAAAMTGKRFIFLTANQVELLAKETVDLFVNIDSFGEMDARAVRNYIAIMRATVRPGGGAYLRNFFPHCTSIDGEKGWVLPSAEDYRFGEGWDVADSGPWPPDPDIYLETVLRKMACNSVWSRK